MEGLTGAIVDVQHSRYILNSEDSVK